MMIVHQITNQPQLQSAPGEYCQSLETSHGDDVGGGDTDDADDVGGGDTDDAGLEDCYQTHSSINPQPLRIQTRV